MPTDALTYKILANELNQTLKGGRIDKISMPSFNTVLLTIYANKQNHTLLISADPTRARCHLTKQAFSNLSVAPAFLMHLRKHIQGGKIEEIETLPNERILNITLTARSELKLTETKILSAELMGKHSNILLINENKTISEVLRKVAPDLNTKRVLLAGAVYPPVESKATVDTFTKEALTSFLEAFEGGNLTTFIQNGLRCLAKDSINHAIFQTFNSLNPNDFFDQKFPILAQNLLRLLNEKSCSPCVRILENRPTDFYAFPYAFLDKSELKFFDSLSSAADFYYSNIAETEGQKQLLNTLNSALLSSHKKAEKKLAFIIEREDLASGFERDRLFGELLTANIYAIKKGASEFEAVNYYDENPLTKVKIPLTINLSPQANAQKYFKQYSKKKRTILMSKEQKEKTLNEIDYLNSISYSLKQFSNTENLLEIKQELIQNGILKDKKTPQKNKKEPQQKLKFASFLVDDYQILLGKNNLQNEQLFKQAKPYDLWLHVKDEHGSHVVIISKTKDFPPDNVLLTAASLAAYYSKARNADKVAVDYTFSKNVTKPPSTPLGYVTYTNQYTVNVKPKNILLS